MQYFFEQPVDYNRTRIFFINLRNCMLEPENDERLLKINLAIADEDIAVVSELYPVRTPKSNNRELLVVGDECIVGYREHLERWQQRGWQIDRTAVEAAGVDVAWAIPSPERRQQKNWVLDAIPLVGATSA